MTKIRIAVAGAGMIGQAHIKVLGDSPSCMLSAIVDPSHAAGNKLRKKTSLMRVMLAKIAM